MKFTNGTFHVVKTPNNDYIVDSEDEAIDVLKEDATDIQPDSSDVTIVKVTTSEDDWSLKEMPWQEIALRLLKED